MQKYDAPLLKAIELLNSPKVSFLKIETISLALKKKPLH
jgi:hypothetical protein